MAAMFFWCQSYIWSTTVLHNMFQNQMQYRAAYRIQDWGGGGGIIGSNAMYVQFKGVGG